MSPQGDPRRGTDRGWGPTARGGPGRRWPQRLALALAAAAVALASASLASVARTVTEVEAEREKVAIEALETETPEPTEPLNVLLVGSDGRDDLTLEEQRELTLGAFEGERADTNLLFSVSADRSTINVVSVPRDLAIQRPGRDPIKLSETLLAGGEDEYVTAMTEVLGFPVNHYVQISITGFLRTVDALGGVEICLDEPLYDSKSGAAFEAGCQLMDNTQALAYVRSRQGSTGDYERIGRQQDFLKSLAAQLVDARLLLEPRRLRAVGNEVAQAVVTDDGLGVDTAIQLAQDLQPLVAGGLPTVTVPGYPRDLVTDEGTRNFVLPYRPGLEAIVEGLQANEPLPSRGDPEGREATDVRLWSGDRFTATETVASTLFYGGFTPLGSTAGDLDAGATTVVYSLPGAREQAAWVAAYLGAEVEQLPAELVDGLDEGVEVVVAVGDDAEPDPDLVALWVQE